MQYFFIERFWYSRVTLALKARKLMCDQGCSNLGYGMFLILLFVKNCRTVWSLRLRRSTVSWPTPKRREMFEATTVFTSAKATPASTSWAASTRTDSRRTLRSRSMERSFKACEDASCCRKTAQIAKGRKRLRSKLRFGQHLVPLKKVIPWAIDGWSR